LIIPAHLTALSNMPIKSEKPFLDGSKKPTEKDLKRVEFEETPIMSTYVNPFPTRTFSVLMLMAR
jgi:hypothetical protein